MGNLCGVAHPQYVQVVMLGLDGSGKTSLLQRIVKENGGMTSWLWGSASTPPVSTGIEAPEREMQSSISNQSDERFINTDIVTVRGKSFVFFDLGGKKDHRSKWSDFITMKTFAIMFVVDASAHQRIAEAAEVLHNVVLPLIPLSITPLVIVCHKCDRIGSMTRREITDSLGLQNLPLQNWKIISTTILQSGGISSEAVEFLAAANQRLSQDFADQDPEVNRRLRTDRGISIKKSKKENIVSKPLNETIPTSAADEETLVDYNSIEVSQRESEQIISCEDEQKSQSVPQQTFEPIKSQLFSESSQEHVLISEEEKADDVDVQQPVEKQQNEPTALSIADDEKQLVKAEAALEETRSGEDPSPPHHDNDVRPESPPLATSDYTAARDAAKTESETGSACAAEGTKKAGGRRSRHRRRKKKPTD